jgi:hypothetical protein
VVDSLIKGTDVTVVFNVDVYKYIPPGEHRLPIRYTGYYQDDGSFSYTDWKYTSDSTYYSIKGKELYLKVTVSDREMAISAQSTNSFNLGGTTKALQVPVELTNHEEVQYDDVVLRLATFPRNSPMNPVFVNPGAPVSSSLDEVDILTLPASSTETVTFAADLAPNVKPGGYELELNLTAMDHNSMVQVSRTIVVGFQVYPMATNFAISTSYSQSLVKAGKEFQLTVSLENIGLDRAREVYVTVGHPEGGLLSNTVLDLHDMEPSTLEHTLNPFTVGSARVFVGDVAPGATDLVNFTVYVDYEVVKGRSYEMSIYTTYRDSFGGIWNQTNPISVTAVGTREAKAAAADPWDRAITPILAIIVVTWLLIVIGAIILMRMGRPKVAREPQIHSPMPPQSPAVPPPQEYAPPQQQYFAPRPATPTAPPSPPQPVEGPRPCHKCGAPVPPGNYICPNCGSPV